MVKLITFETVQELEELTGLTEELWNIGFNLDDWDIGFQSDTKLHVDPTPEEIEKGECCEWELLVPYRSPAYWLMNQMNNYCVGASYVFYKDKHYYTVHHA